MNRDDLNKNLERLRKEAGAISKFQAKYLRGGGAIAGLSLIGAALEETVAKAKALSDELKEGKK